jgi:vacuolar-type H+-ATPase subunit H
MTAEGGGALDALLQLERRIEAEIGAARAEAERRIESAREAAHRLESDAGGSLEAALAALRDSIDRETAAAIEREQREARAEADRYSGLDEEAIAQLARTVVARITATESGA